MERSTLTTEATSKGSSPMESQTLPEGASSIRTDLTTSEVFRITMPMGKECIPTKTILWFTREILSTTSLRAEGLNTTPMAAATKETSDSEEKKAEVFFTGETGQSTKGNSKEGSCKDTEFTSSQMEKFTKENSEGTKDTVLESILLQSEPTTVIKWLFRWI